MTAKLNDIDNLIPDLNVYDNIIFPLELDGAQIDKEFIQELYIKYLK